ncbi:MAG: bacillithiol biosynthesis deacetylase BshB1 [Thermoguttaceae bacterium]|jgi:bacillithiol biosynthesis deacetylase BshB1
MLDCLVVAPHPDDAELGMGGAIVKFLAEGLAVGVLDLTDGEPTPHGSPQIRRRETAEATKILGLPWRENLGLPNRTLEPTLAARAALAAVFRRVRPRWIFAPYWIDAHPDHVAATQLIEAARFWSKLTKSDMPGEPFYPERIFCYYCVHRRLLPQPAFVLDIGDFWEKKRTALECYRSQFLGDCPNFRLNENGTVPLDAGTAHSGPEVKAAPTIIDRLRDQAAFWGSLIGVRYAEPFASREPVGLATMKGIV